MDFSPEGLRNRATAVFATLTVKRKGLPRRLTPELERRGHELSAMAMRGLGKNKAFLKCVCDAFDHKEDGLALWVFLMPSQCALGTELAKVESLDSQIMFVTSETLASLTRNPDTVPTEMKPHLVHVPKVWVRLEVMLTMQEDCNISEFFVLDPRAELYNGLEDLETMRRRFRKQTNIPNETLDAILHACKHCSLEDLDAITNRFATPSEIQDAYATNLRGCAAPGCGKYGVTMRKCSGCRAVYYCDQQCQLAHWPTHKGTCGVSSDKK